MLEYNVQILQLLLFAFVAFISCFNGHKSSFLFQQYVSYFTTTWVWRMTFVIYRPVFSFSFSLASDDNGSGECIYMFPKVLNKCTKV